MKLHIFNPEHDIALAANQERFTAPHAGRRLRTDLGFIPAFWASEGDMVLVDDVEAAIEARRHLSKFGKDVVFVTYADLKRFNPWLRDRKLLTGGRVFRLTIPQADAISYKTPNDVVHNPAWVVASN